MGHTVYLALGTNLGDRRANLQAALDALSPEVRIRTRSAIYETPPWGYLDQPAFLNQVIKAETDLSPQDLLSCLKHVESQMGRQKTIRNGPRIIDLDILFYDDLVAEYSDPEFPLSLPHPRMEGRAFVLVPLANLEPNLRHPNSGQTIREMLENVNTEGIHPINGS